MFPGLQTQLTRGRRGRRNLGEERGRETEEEMVRKVSFLMYARVHVYKPASHSILYFRFTWHPPPFLFLPLSQPPSLTLFFLTLPPSLSIPPTFLPPSSLLLYVYPLLDSDRRRRHISSSEEEEKEDERCKSRRRREREEHGDTRRAEKVGVAVSTADTYTTTTPFSYHSFPSASYSLPPFLHLQPPSRSPSPPPPAVPYLFE